MATLSKVCLGLLIAVIAAVAPAAAQTVTDQFNSTSVLISSGLGGWTVSITNCSDTSNSVSVGCSGNVEVIATVSHNTLSLAFEGYTGGALETTSSTKLGDVGASIVVTPPNGYFWQTTANETGSSTGGSTDYSRISASEIGLTVSYGSIVGPSSQLSNSPTLATTTFAQSPTVSSIVDLRSQGGGVGGASAGTLTMSSATFTYTVPEPMTSSVLLVGLAGLGFVRRRRR